MTVEKFIQSVNKYQPGSLGFCKLASVSPRDSNIVYNFGFWFEVIKTNGTVVLSVQNNSLKNNEPQKTIVIAAEKQLHDFTEDMRQRAVDELSSFLFST